MYSTGCGRALKARTGEVMNRREAFLCRFLPVEAAETLMGDLNEESRESILPCYGRAISSVWY